MGGVGRSAPPPSVSIAVGGYSADHNNIIARVISHRNDTFSTKILMTVASNKISQKANNNIAWIKTL